MSPGSQAASAIEVLLRQNGSPSYSVASTARILKKEKSSALQTLLPEILLSSSCCCCCSCGSCRHHHLHNPPTPTETATSRHQPSQSPKLPSPMVPHGALRLIFFPDAFSGWSPGRSAPPSSTTELYHESAAAVKMIQKALRVSKGSFGVARSVHFSVQGQPQCPLGSK